MSRFPVKLKSLFLPLLSLGVLSGCSTVPCAQISPQPPASLLIRPAEPTLLGPQLISKTFSKPTPSTQASTQSVGRN